MKQSCKTCKFAVMFERMMDEKPVRECRRFPPPGTRRRFPKVHETEWCGEYVEDSGDG